MDRRKNAVGQLLTRATAAQREADALCVPATTVVGKRGAEGRTREAAVRRCYPAVAGSVPLARAAVARLAARAKPSPARLDAVRLAVSEAVTNAAIHAYPSMPGQIHIPAALATGELTVLIADDGVGPRTPPRRPGPGWGWPLMTSCSDRLTITQRGNGGTLVEVRWNLEPATTAEAHPG